MAARRRRMRMTPFHIKNTQVICSRMALSSTVDTHMSCGCECGLRTKDSLQLAMDWQQKASAADFPFINMRHSKRPTTTITTNNVSVAIYRYFHLLLNLHSYNIISIYCMCVYSYGHSCSTFKFTFTFK